MLVYVFSTRYLLPWSNLDFRSHGRLDGDMAEATAETNLRRSLESGVPLGRHAEFKCVLAVIAAMVLPYYSRSAVVFSTMRE